MKDALIPYRNVEKKKMPKKKKKKKRYNKGRT